jgi:hypothetical protein
MRGLSRVLVLATLAAGILAFPLAAAAGHDNDPRTPNMHPMGHIEEPASLFGRNPDIHTDIAFWGSDPDFEHTYFFYDSATGDKVGEWTLPRKQSSLERTARCTTQRGAAPERALRARARELPVRDERRRLHGSGERGRARLERSPAAAQAPDVAVLLRGQRSLVLVLVQQLHLRDEHHDGLNIFRFSGSQTGGAVMQGHSNPQTQEFTIG